MYMYMYMYMQVFRRVNYRFDTVLDFEQTFVLVKSELESLISAVCLRIIDQCCVSQNH